MGQKCQPWPIHLRRSQWKLRVDLAGICVFCLCLLFVCLWMCSCACVCGGERAIVPRHLPTGSLSDWWISVFKVSLKNSIVCLCSTVFKHPVLRLPPLTKEKINPLLTPMNNERPGPLSHQPSLLAPNRGRKGKWMLEVRKEKYLKKRKEKGN